MCFVRPVSEQPNNEGFFEIVENGIGPEILVAFRENELEEVMGAVMQTCDGDSYYEVTDRDLDENGRIVFESDTTTRFEIDEDDIRERIVIPVGVRREELRFFIVVSEDYEEENTWFVVYPAKRV